MVRLIYILMFGLIANTYSQESISFQCHGKVTNELNTVDGIYVVNLKTENTSITDKEGYFTIAGNVGDTLFFSSFQLKSRKIVLTQENLKGKLLFVTMLPILNELKEVVIKQPVVSAESLGIIPYGQKKYTPAERKLATASSGRLNPMGLDPLLNYLSGRTAMLKKELEVEKKERYLVQLENLFDKKHFVNILQIPSIHVKGFMYFAVDNPKFTRVLKTKNRTATEFLLAELATQYIEIISPKEEN